MYLFNKFLRHSFIQGGIVFTLSNFFMGFLNYLFTILAGRILGPEGYGEIATLFAYTVIFSTPLGILSHIIVQKIGKAENQKIYSYGLFKWIQTIIKKYILWGFLPFIVIPFLPELTNLQPLVAYLIIPFIYLSFFSVIYDSIFQGMHMLLAFSLLNILIVTIKLLGPVAGSFFPNALIIILIFLVISGLVKLWLSHIVFKKIFNDLSDSSTFPGKNIRQLLSDQQLRMTTASTIAIAILSNIDIMVAKKVLTAEAAGIYALWSLFAKIILYVLSPLITLAFLFFSNKKYANRHTITFIIALITLTFSGLSATVIYTLFGEQLISYIFNDKYLPILPYITSAALFGMGYVIVVFINNYFLAQRNKHVYILPLLIPIYVLSLLLFGSNILELINVNIAFTFGLLGVYSFLYLKKLIHDKYIIFIK